MVISRLRTGAGNHSGILKDLVAKYNDAIETIWHYQKIIFELRQENEEILAAYEDISNQFYG